LPGKIVVERNYFVAFAEQPFAEMRADESGASGN
jgi:hypothetical protein